MQAPAQDVAIEATLRDHPAVHQHHRHPEVVEPEELGVGVHVALSWLYAQLPQRRQRVVAQMTSPAGDQLDVHAASLAVGVPLLGFAFDRSSDGFCDLGSAAMRPRPPSWMQSEPVYSLVSELALSGAGRARSLGGRGG